MTFRPSAARVDLEAIRHNVRGLKPAGSELMAVVKAGGYGHGAVPVARAALEAGATWLGVALVEEGIELRDAGIRAPVLLLSEAPRGSEKDALAAGLTPSLYSSHGLTALAAARESLGEPVAAHLKVDTGMHRVGVRPDDAAELATEAARNGIEVEGVWTHLAKADVPGDRSIDIQMERFEPVLERVERAGAPVRYRHAANSAATMTVPRSHLDLVRTGIAIYGIAPSEEVGRRELRPAMSVESRVAFSRRVEAGEGVSYGLRYRLEKDSTIATVPFGYADGYPRAASGKAEVLIRGKRYPVAGTVTMDQITVDVGDDPIQEGDVVTIVGRQGDEEIAAEDMAGWAGTIGYEIVCGIGPRVPRVLSGER